MELRTAGGSEAAMVGRLGGQGRITVVNGAIRGLDLFAMARNVAAAFSGGENNTARTSFTRLAGSFRVTNGVLVNNDLVMTSSPMSFEGNGTINLPPRTLHYRIDPKLLGTAQACNRSDALLGVNIPIIVSGSLDDPTFAPGLEIGVPSLPGKALETIERVIPREVNPVDPLRRLFGR
ncbi:MAG: AsmA family protein [Alphaproteobacteria bacterium]|nr:AsmA family protein [Alphaproteobacteria bacterium]